MEKLIARFEYKHPNFGIDNLILYIIGPMVMIFLADWALPEVGLLSLLEFNREAIFSGQVWRLISFVFIPSYSSIIWMFFGALLMYSIGSALESAWGSCRFTIYYLIGVVFNIVAGLICGYSDNYYLNLSLFLAYAMLYPNEEIRFYFLISVKVKWLGIIAGVLMALMFLFTGIIGKILIIASMLNFFLFFGGVFIKKIKDYYKYKPARDNFKRQMREVKRRNDDDE